MPRPYLCRLLLLVALTLASTASLRAQQVIEGRIKDDKNVPVPDAAIVLLSTTDSSLIQSALTDATGDFRLNAPTLKQIFLKIYALGYQDKYLRLTDSMSAMIHLDISLSGTSKHLSGVTVMATKPLIERKVDRTVFNVENSTATVGADALEALKRAPGVRASDKGVTIVGKSSVNVMINDKLIQVSGDELANLLKSIPADNISRIEVITTPPARYDAAGNAGLINIVTKKIQRNGLNGNVSVRYMQRTSHAEGFNGNFNYQHDGLNVYGIFNAYRSNTMPSLNINTQYTDQRWEQQTNATNKNVFNRGQIGADYNLSPRSVIGFLYTRGNGGDQYDADATIRSNGYNLQTGRIDSFITTRALTQDRGYRNAGNLNYVWKIDSNGRKLNADLDYFSRTGKAYRNLATNNFLESGVSTGFSAITRTSGIQDVDIRSGKVDLEWPTTFAQLTFGGKVSFIHNTSNNLFEYQDGGVYKVDTGKTNEFDYRENTQALYASARKTMGKWEAQIGLRGEYTQTRSYSATTGQTAKNDYFRIFPTVFIQYKPNEEQAFNINYSKRIARPDFWSMNPFRTYYTATSYSQGNPFLQPSFSNNFELGYTLNAKYNFSLYAQLVDNLQTRVSIIDTVNKAYLFNMANVGSVRNFGATANITLNPFTWWECTLSGHAWYSKFSSGFYGSGQAAYSMPGYTLEANNTFTLNKSKTLIAELNFSYNSRTLDDFDIIYSYENLGLGIKALFFQKRFIVACYGNDILRTEITRLNNQYNNTTQNNYWDERTLRLSLSWKFGRDAIKATRDRKSGTDDDGRAR